MGEGDGEVNGYDSEQNEDHPEDEGGEADNGYEQSQEVEDDEAVSRGRSNRMIIDIRAWRSVW